MSDDYTLTAKEEIRKWESAGPGFLSRVSDIALWPVQKAVDTFIPEDVQEGVTKAVFKALSGLGSSTHLLINEREVKKKVTEHRQDHGFVLRAMDEAAKHYWRYHVGYAAAQGAATGATGWIGLIADIPALFTISFRLIQQIGICYGYDIRKKSEQEYIMHIFRTASSGDVRAKMEFMLALKQVEEILRIVSWKKLGDTFAAKELTEHSLIVGIRQLARSMGINITKRKALILVPVFGAVIGGGYNSLFINDIGEAAYMSYRRRRLDEDEGMDAASLFL